MGRGGIYPWLCGAARRFACAGDDQIRLGQDYSPHNLRSSDFGVYRPDRYDPNARRIGIALDARVLDFLNGEPLVFKIPMLEKRVFVMDDKRGNAEGIGVIVNGFRGGLLLTPTVLKKWITPRRLPRFRF